MAKYPSRNLKKGETLKFKLSFDEPQGPYPNKFGEGEQYLYGIRADGKMINFYVPDFVSACIEALGVKQGSELTVTNIDYEKWTVTYNGEEYQAVSTGTAKEAVDTKQSDEFNAVMDISEVMKRCWAEAGLIMSGVDRADAAPETVLSETGLTARCMLIQYYKANND